MKIKTDILKVEKVEESYLMGCYALLFGEWEVRVCDAQGVCKFSLHLYM